MMNDNALGSPERLLACLAELSGTIDQRAGADPETSYTAQLLAGGLLKCAQKVAEEGSELALAIAAQDDIAVAEEASDLIYHMLVGLRAKGVSLDQLAECLIRRQGLSGLTEKARRAQP